MLLDLIFPNRCLHCNSVISGAELVCTLCMGKINFYHHNSGSDNRFLEHCKLYFPVENAFALMNFDDDGVSREIVHSLKYKNREIVGKILAEWVSERIILPENSRPELIVTVPLHPKKQRERGYNQLHLFADCLSKYYKIPADHEVLKRTKYKKAQALADKEHRTSTENIFTLNKKISGKHILLIDDVYTTGNTMSTVAWELIKQNNMVSVLVMAVD